MYEDLDRTNPEFHIRLQKRTQILYSILAQNKEQSVVGEAMKTFNMNKDYNIFAKKISLTNSNYKSGLSEEEKWYFELGDLYGEMDAGIRTKNAFFFVLTGDSFNKLFKKTPTNIPTNLLSSLKITEQLAQKNNFPIGASDEPFNNLREQMQKIFEIIGKISNNDVKK